MPKFAANLSFLFTELPFLERFGAARRAGFEAVECLFPYAYPAEQIGEQLEQHRLQLVLHNLPPGDWDAGARGLACDPAQRLAFQDSVGLALDYALALGVPQLHCLAGIAAQDEASHALYLENLRFAAHALQQHGLRLLIEPLNHFDVPGYFLTSSAQAAKIIAQAAQPNLFLQYDIYHMQRMEGRLAETIGNLLPLIAHMQLADTPGRHEPGTGEIDFPSLLQAIDQLGYTGWIGCEYKPSTDSLSSLHWCIDLKQ